MKFPVTVYAFVDEETIIEELFLKFQPPFYTGDIRDIVWKSLEEEEASSPVHKLTSQQLNDICVQIIGKLCLQGYDIQAGSSK